jgi:hypothetical protein
MSYSTTITGIGTASVSTTEYTSGTVLNTYLSNVNVLLNIFNERAGTGSSSTQPTMQDFNNMMLALSNLNNLALNGAQEGTPPNTYYLTSEMANDLDLVNRSLQASGISLSQYQAGDYDSLTDAQVISLMQNWQSLAGFGVQNVMNTAASVSSDSTQTLQSMVELDYVQAGNQMLSTQLGSLETALTNTQNVLNSLQVIQGISNEITVTNKGGFAFPPTNDYQIPSTAINQIQSIFNQIAGSSTSNAIYSEMRDFTGFWTSDVSQAAQSALSNGTTMSTELSKLGRAAQVINDVINYNWGSAGKTGASGSLTVEYYTSLYQAVASAQFNQVFPVATPTSTAAVDLLSAKNQLYQELVQLEQISPANSRSTVGTLASFMYQVTLDISNAFNGVSSTNAAAMQAAVSTWILDNQDQQESSSLATSAGSIQNNITNAVNAAQTLNDSQQQDVSNYTFIFQEFYQSASTVLQGITDIIASMAQNAGQ